MERIASSTNYESVTNIRIPNEPDSISLATDTVIKTDTIIKTDTVAAKPDTTQKEGEALKSKIKYCSRISKLYFYAIGKYR